MRILKASLLLALTLAAANAFGEETLWRSGRSTIELLGTEAKYLTEYHFEVRAEGRPAQRSTFRAKELDLEKAWIGPGETLWSLGRSKSGAAHLLVGRLGQDGNDWIITWRNELSPSGKYYALQRFVPAHGPVPPDSVTIYDLQKSVAANDFAGDPLPELFPLECIGRVVYPEDLAFRESCGVDGSGKNRQLVSPFLWLEVDADERLFFLVQEDDELFLIRTQLPFPDAPVVIWRQQVDLRGRYHPEPNNDLNFKKGLKFLADKLSWTAEGRIQVDLDPIYGFGPSFELEAN